MFKKLIKITLNYKIMHILNTRAMVFWEKDLKCIFPGEWPTYYSKSKGINIWDLKGKKYLDFTMLGVGSCVFGYSDKDVNKVATKVINGGPLTTLNQLKKRVSRDIAGYSSLGRSS